MQLSPGDLQRIRRNAERLEQLDKKPVFKATNISTPTEIHYRLNESGNLNSWLPYGWYKLVVDLDKELSKIVPDYLISQCKEKLGTLRFYTTFPTEVKGVRYKKFFNTVQRYVEKSSTVCDVCGKAGTLINNDDILMTRCSEHSDVDRNIIR